MARRRDFGQVVDQVLKVLRRTAPTVLTELRDCSAPDTDAVVQWVNRYFLNSERLIALALSLRKYWAQNPRAAAELCVVDVLHLIGISESEAHRQWIQEHCGSADAAEMLLLPNPRAETVNEWLARAKALYMERAAFSGGPLKRRRNNFPRHCEWFVDVQVKGMPLSTVARVRGVTWAAVDRGIQPIADALGINRRRT